MIATVILPDILSPWPVRHALNPHYEEVGSESTRWMESFHVLEPKAQAVFNTHNFALAASRMYPYVNREHLRLACDIMNWYFAYDAVTDDEPGAPTQEIATTLINILRDPSAPLPKPFPLGEMTKSLWSRMIAFATPSTSQRMRAHLQRYIRAVGIEAEDREGGIIRPIENFLILRRDTAAVNSVMDIILLRHDIPEEVMTHPSVQKLTVKTMDMQVFINDIISFNFERRHGQAGHNLVTAIMKEKSLDVQAAMDFAGDWCHQTIRSLLEDFKAVPSFSPPIDKAIQEYIAGLIDMTTGHYDWSFESKRYFGNEGLEVKRTRVVQLFQPPEQKSGVREEYNTMGTWRALQVA